MREKYFIVVYRYLDWQVCTFPEHIGFGGRKEKESSNQDLIKKNNNNG